MQVDNPYEQANNATDVLLTKKIMCCGHRLYSGIVMLVMGVLFLLGTLGIIEFAFATYWPLFPILLGIDFLFFPKK